VTSLTEVATQQSPEDSVCRNYILEDMWVNMHGPTRED